VTAVLVIVIVVLACSVGALAYSNLRGRGRRLAPPSATGTTRILFPFVARALSPRALDAALRLARADGGTLVPVFLARVSLDLPLDAPLPRQSGLALPLQEAIEQRAAHYGVPVDARIERGRTYRHALRQTIENERFDRIVIATTGTSRAGFSADDAAWVLDNAPGEIIVIRPEDDPLWDGGTVRRCPSYMRWRSSPPESPRERSTRSSAAAP
jgi:nucleotide-binding universal stress UspA family protein